MWHWFRWVLLSIGFIVLFLIISYFIFPPKKNQSTNVSEEKPQITKNFVDLNMVEAVTKYRSCQGHLVVPQADSETKSNMKHYFYLKKEYTTTPNMVPIYAPIDGYVDSIMTDFKGEGRKVGSSDVSLATSKSNTWMVTLMHIVPGDGLKKGDSVKAGDLVGYVSLDVPPVFAFDVIYAKFANRPKSIDGWMDPYAEIDSIFNHMSEDVLLEYTTRFGISSKDDLIITKDERNLNQCQYEGNGPRFKSYNDENKRNDDFVGKMEF